MGGRFSLFVCSDDILILNDFNGIAKIYDQLGLLVFFDRLHLAQLPFLDQIKPNEQILILGGGTGKILENLEVLNLNLKIDFVEPSLTMLTQAKSRNANHVNFHPLKFEDFSEGQQYDWVFCGFFLDLFPEQILRNNLNRIKFLMKPTAKLQVVDFQIIDDSWWQRTMSILMHSFFRVFADLQNDRLLNIRQVIRSASFEPTSSKTFFAGFIFSELFTFTKQ